MRAWTWHSQFVWLCIVELGYVPSMTSIHTFRVLTHMYVCRDDYTYAHGATMCDHANAPHVIIPSWTTTLAVSSNFRAASRDNSIRNFVTAFSSGDPRRRWTPSLIITEFKVHPRPSLIILSASRYCNFVLRGDQIAGTSNASCED